MNLSPIQTIMQLPPQEPTIGHCKGCERPVHTMRFRVAEDAPWVVLPKLCPHCQEDRELRRRERREELHREEIARRTYKWEERYKALAGIMQDSIVDLIPNDQLRIFAAMPYDGRSFLFVGPSQIGKTRTAFLILRSALRQGMSAQAISQPALADEIQKDKYKTHREEIVDRLTATDVLLLDDCWQGQKNEATEQAMFRILDDRFKTGRNTIITTNFTGREWIAFAKSPEAKTMHAIIERIRRRFTIVKIK